MIEIDKSSYYNFIGQEEKLRFIGIDGLWYQFAKEGEDECWAELMHSDLVLLEKQNDN